MRFRGSDTPSPEPERANLHPSHRHLRQRKAAHPRTSSIRRKITTLGVSAIIATLAIIAMLGVFAITSMGRKNTDQTLRLLCESGEKNLDSYLESVEQSVAMVSAYVETDLVGLKTGDLGDHLDRARTIFARMASETNGVLTYYYRIDPTLTTDVQGFWYVDLDGRGFVEHQVTDISRYDTLDTSELVWFTIPKTTGRPMWLHPYVTDNLGVLVVSYNVPVYMGDRFIGVIGIEIDHSTLAEQVDNITLFDNGYAFVTDRDGVLLYHPRIDLTTTSAKPATPQGLASDEPNVRYIYNDVLREAFWRPLSNGSRLYVSVPVSEINASWHLWIIRIAVVSVALLAIAILLFVYILRILQAQQAMEEENTRLAEALASAAELTELMASMSSLLTNMPAMSFSKDVSSRAYLACNQAFAHHVGKAEPKEITGLTDFDLFDHETALNITADDDKALATDGLYDHLEEVTDTDGNVTCYLQTTKKKFRDATGRQCLLGLRVDVTETTRAKAAEAARQATEQEKLRNQTREADLRHHVEQLSYEASHDKLTDAYNRTGYEVLLRNLDLPSTYLLMVDIDDFKLVNDTYGHEVGDRVLVKVANTLRRQFRSHDHICRIGGDEFVVLMTQAQGDLRTLIAEKIMRINHELGHRGDGLPAVSVSVGVAFGSDAGDAERLMDHADQAMYETKRAGKSGYRFSGEQS